VVGTRSTSASRAAEGVGKGGGGERARCFISTCPFLKGGPCCSDRNTIIMYTFIHPQDTTAG
jgi:hypothetical protein